MSRVFVIADLHFGHRKVAAARGFDSPADHDEALIDAWNRTVGKRDVVYVLGDLFEQGTVARCAGTKKLALGNHDTRPMAKYLDLFSQVRGYYEFDGCLMSHIPVHKSQRGRWELNIHGHTHGRDIDDPWYVNVSVERLPVFAPTPLPELIHARRSTQ